MGAALGISHQSVQTIWTRNDLKPHLTRTFKISNNPHFEDKFRDIIGLYLHPPDRALVLRCDKKSQCQALERTQPVLPLGMDHIRPKTHDYHRHGALTLFAALNYLDGKWSSPTERRHTHVEWPRLLKQIHREMPKSFTIHVIADNYAALKHQHVKDWLTNHTRFQMHVTPTSSSRMNLVERFFGELTADCIQDGSFQNIGELADSVMEYLAACNRDSERSVWKAKRVAILKKIALNPILST